MSGRVCNLYLVFRIPRRGRPPPPGPVRFGQWQDAPARDAPHLPELDAWQRRGATALRVLRGMMLFAAVLVLIAGGLLARRLTIG